VIGDISVGIGVYMSTDEPDLTVTDIGVGFLDIRLAIPDRLDLGSLEGHPRFDLLQDLVVKPRLAVLD
jgi:hypothetical protein